MLRKAEVLAADEPEATAEKYLLGRARESLSGGGCLLSVGGVSVVKRMCLLSDVGALAGKTTDSRCGGAYYQRWRCLLSAVMTSAVKARRSAFVVVISPVKGYRQCLASGVKW